MRILHTIPGKKLLFTLSAVLISPLAQAHDNSPSTGLLAHIWTHGVELANTGFGIGFLGGVTLLAALFFATRLRARATIANHG